MGRNFAAFNPEYPRSLQPPTTRAATTRAATTRAATTRAATTRAAATPTQTRDQTGIHGHGDGDARRLRSARTCPSMNPSQPDAGAKARASLDSFRPGSLRIKKFDGKARTSSNWNSLRRVCHRSVPSTLG